MAEGNSNISNSRRTWAALFALISLAILAMGYWYYRVETQRIRQQKYREIAAIGELKVGQILRWRKERLRDVGRVARCPFLRRAPAELLRGAGAPGLRAALRGHLALERNQDTYTDVLLFDPKGNCRLSAKDNPDPVAPATRRIVAVALAEGKAVLSDLRLGPNGGDHIDAAAPMLDGEGRAAAVVVLRSDAREFLYPLIQSWPTPSRSAETLLVRRMGEEVVVLTDVRHRSKTALSLRMPISRRDLPAVQAVLGKRGMFLSVDYRGVEVLADLRPIPGSPWFLVAKIDTSEIMAEARYRGGLIAVIAVLSILLTSVVVAFAYRQRQAGLYRSLYRSEREQREAQEEFRTTLYGIGDAVIATDAMGQVKRMNPVAERLTGWLEAQAQGKPLDEVFRIVNEETRAVVENPVKRVLREGEVVGLANHTLLTARDGTERPIADSGAPLLGPSGAVTGVVLVFRDQSVERAARKALRESELQYRTLADSGQALIWTSGVDKKFNYFNRPWLSFTGRTLEQELGDGWAEGVHPDDLERCIEIYAGAFDRRERFSMDYRLRRHDGEYRWMRRTGTPRYDSQGDFLGYVGQCLDVTDQKFAEEALRASEARVRLKLASILSPSEDMGELALGDILDTEAVQSLMDDFHRITGLPVAILDLRGKVLVGTGWQDICTQFHRVHPETCRNCIECDTELTKGVEPGTFKAYVCKNNLWDVVTPLMVSGRHAGNLFTGQFFFDDAEPDREIFRAQARRYGFDESAYLSALDRVPRFSREKISVAMSFSMKLAQLISMLSHSNIKLAKSALALRESEERYRHVSSVISDVAYACSAAEDGGHAIDWLTGAVERITGYSVDEIKAMGCWGPLVIEEDRHLFDEKVAGCAPGSSATCELRVRHKDGSVRWLAFSVECVLSRDAPHTQRLYGGLIDLTDRKQAEERLLQAQKMESIGRLAGGVAHDFNNLLSVINGHSDMLLDLLSPEDPLRTNLEMIRRAGEKAAGLTRHLLAFSRRQLLQPRVLDLNLVVEEMRPMLERLVGEDVEVRVELAAEAGIVRADPHQLEQAIMNLVVNGRDAMPRGGKLSIKTVVLEWDNRHAQQHPEARVGPYVMLAVSDSGVGMDEETRRHIFEPFFTTKGVGKGTGLGLSSVQGIVAQSGGFIEVFSEPGGGTIFEIYLPRAEEEVAREVRIPEPLPALGGRETVLVVEDQAEVRDYVVAALKVYGYRIVQAGSANEALSLCEGEGKHIDLLLTDVVMPNAGGRELANRLEKLQPGLKVLFMSGYTDDVILHHGVLAEGVEFIHKPFRPEQLATKVREMLGPPKPLVLILVSDDETGVRAVLRTALARNGYEVLEAENGEQVIRQAGNGPVDLLITDLAMPEQEGLETIQALRGEAPGVGIIFLAGQFERSSLQMAGSLAADAVVGKPVSSGLLIATVAEVLRSRR
jgi:PAS domain S-box-containing protein